MSARRRADRIRGREIRERATARVVGALPSRVSQQYAQCRTRIFSGLAADIESSELDPFARRSVQMQIFRA